MAARIWSAVAALFTGAGTTDQKRAAKLSKS